MIDIDDYDDLVKSAEDDIEKLELLEEESREFDEEFENLHKIYESEIQRWALECRKRGHNNTAIVSLPKDLQTEHEKIRKADDLEHSRLRRQSDKVRKYSDALRAKLKHNFEWDADKVLRRFNGRLSENVRELVETLEKRLVRKQYFLKPGLLEFLRQEYPEGRGAFAKLRRSENKRIRNINKRLTDPERDSKLLEHVNRMLYEPFYSMSLDKKVKLVTAEDEIFRAWEQREYLPSVSSALKSVDSFLISEFGSASHRKGPSKSVQPTAGLSALIGNSREHLSCFISHSSKDSEFVQRLYLDLEQHNVQCWYAPDDLKIGDRIRPGIDEAIKIHDKLLLVLSRFSVSSAWVEKEVETAFEKERKENSTVLFPVRLDNTVFETDVAWAADIRRTRHIGDFSDWQNAGSYKKALERLIRDLQAVKSGDTEQP